MSTVIPRSESRPLCMSQRTKKPAVFDAVKNILHVPDHPFARTPRKYAFDVTSIGQRRYAFDASLPLASGDTHLTSLPLVSGDMHLTSLPLVSGDTHLTSLPLVNVRCRRRLIRSVEAEIKFHLKCKLHFPCAQLMLRQMHLTNVSESIEAKD